MNLAKYHEDNQIEQRQGTIQEACIRYRLGRALLMQEAIKANAIIRLGKRVIINYSKLDNHFDNLSGN